MSSASTQYADWEYSGSIYILTTPDGANLPASASVKDFPLLVRLHSDHFPFSQAEEGGNDIRFSAGGEPLSYEIETWDKEAGASSIWVRIRRKVSGPISTAELRQAYYTSAAKDAIALEFDQPVVWKDSLISEFRLDGAKGKVTSGAVSGNVLTLKLKEPVRSGKITYLDEMAWSQDRLLVGKNGIAVLTFCNVPVLDARKTERKSRKY